MGFEEREWGDEHECLPQRVSSFYDIIWWMLWWINSTFISYYLFSWAEAAQICCVTGDGKFLYVSNRGHDSITAPWTADGYPPVLCYSLRTGRWHICRLFASICCKFPEGMFESRWPSNAVDGFNLFTPFFGFSDHISTKRDTTPWPWMCHFTVVTFLMI